MMTSQLANKRMMKEEGSSPGTFDQGARGMMMMPQLGMCVLCGCLSLKSLTPSYGLGSVYLPLDRFHRVILSLESPTAGFDLQFIVSYVFFFVFLIIILFLKDDVSLIESFTKIQRSEDGAKRNVYVPSSVNLR